MKNKKMLSVLISLLFLMLSSSYAHEQQDWRGTGGWGSGHPYQRMYSPKAIEIYAGEVVAVDTVIPMKGMSPGVHLILLTKEKKSISVHLGPAWFIERLDTQIMKGDTIEVTGSMVIMTVEKEPAKTTYEHTLLAQSVKKGDKILELRDVTGEPVWSGWKEIERKKNTEK